MIYDRNGKPLAMTWEELIEKDRAENPKFWRKIDYIDKKLFEYDGVKSALDGAEEVDFFEDLTWFEKLWCDIQARSYIAQDRFKNWVRRLFNEKTDR